MLKLHFWKKRCKTGLLSYLQMTGCSFNSSLKSSSPHPNCRHFSGRSSRLFLQLFSVLLPSSSDSLSRILIISASPRYAFGY